MQQSSKLGKIRRRLMAGLCCIILFAADVTAAAPAWAKEDDTAVEQMQEAGEESGSQEQESGEESGSQSKRPEEQSAEDSAQDMTAEKSEDDVTSDEAGSEPDASEKDETPVTQEPNEEQTSESENDGQAEEEESALDVAAADAETPIELKADAKVTQTYGNYKLEFTIAQKEDLTWYLKLTKYVDTSTGNIKYDVTIPSRVTISPANADPIALPVTEIAAEVFKGKTKLFKVLFEADPQLVKIGNSAFQGCTNLGYIEWPATLTTIGRWAFSGDVLLGRFDKNTDSSTPNPTPVSELRLQLPDSVVSIGEKAFEQCNAYTSVVVPKDLAKIPGPQTGDTYGPFYNCTGIKVIELEQGMDVIPADLFHGAIRKGSVEFRIPDSVTTIGSRAFRKQTSLTKLEFGNDTKLTTISYAAFQECTELAYIDMPDTLTHIGQICIFRRYEAWKP